jgi:GABA(A) receptor-associated protein
MTDNIKSLNDFKKIDFDKRLSESKRIMAKYPDRIPLIVFKDPKSQLAQLDKYKYLIPLDLTLGQFIHVIRKKIKLGPEKSIFLFTQQNNIINVSELMNSVYKKHKDEDGFLYLVYFEENTFG